MRVFKTKWFTRFARREHITDSALLEAIERAERGLVDADLGSHVIMQRVARAGQGRSGGYRTIIAFRAGELAFFIYGLAKNDQDNLAPDDENDYKAAARKLMEISDNLLTELAQDGTLTEVEIDA